MIERERLSRPDAGDLVAVAEGGPDVAALREEAAAIRRNLEEMAADRALGLITRAQMLTATGRGNARLAEIGADLEAAARENVLARWQQWRTRLRCWEDLDLSRRRRPRTVPANRRSTQVARLERHRLPGGTQRLEDYVGP